MKLGRERVPLAPLTTIGLGGTARYFISCAKVAELQQALVFARERKLPVAVLGGGSNTVFADGGFDGLVIHVALSGTTFGADGKVAAGAGEKWDDLVRSSVERGLAGIECLSGIPGLVGATPMQNVGAYGQQVADVITGVTALDRRTLEVVSLNNRQCVFSYRQSRFKGADFGQYIITAVMYQLEPGGQPKLKYPELAAAVSDRPSLMEVREAVLALRRRKSMVVNAADPYSRSCGSFFMNVVLSKGDFDRLCQRYAQQGGSGDVPSFPDGDCRKVPAAWLVEQAGFSKGERRGKVGISPNHALALVNYGGTSAELLDLAADIQAAVKKTFGLTLVREPVVVPESD
jgi:UDP-N-acetylmuramate dehydrogenase